jgi:multidrug resistance efflux pump
MSNNLNNLCNEEISDLLDDASKTGTPNLTTQQVEHLCTIATIEITNADTTVSPDQLMATINDNMAKFILKSTKPTAICDAMKEIKNYSKQVLRYEKKLKQVNEYLDEQEKLVNDGRMSRSSAQFLKAKKEQVSAKNSKPPGDTEVRWEMKKKLVLAYNKYITLYEDLLRQERVKQSAQ